MKLKWEAGLTFHSRPPNAKHPSAQSYSFASSNQPVRPAPICSRMPKHYVFKTLITKINIFNNIHKKSGREQGRVWSSDFSTLFEESSNYIKIVDFSIVRRRKHLQLTRKFLPSKIQFYKYTIQINFRMEMSVNFFGSCNLQTCESQSRKFCFYTV